jgi:acetyl esterase
MITDPQVQAILAMFSSMPVPDLATLKAVDLRAAMTMLKLPSLNEPVAKVADLSFAGPGGPLALRLYHPVKDKNLPAIVFFHGGGWVSCSIDTHDNLCRRLANRSGCAVISVDYRLAPEAVFPAALDDACAAVKWVAEHAKELQIDPLRLAVAGDSSGGNLAAAYTIVARNPASALPRISHQLLFYPVLDDACDSPSFTTYANGYLLTSSMMRWYWNQYVPSLKDQQDPRASPAREKNLRGLPSATIITAQCDPLCDESAVYAERLKEAGVAVQLNCWPGMFHGFASMLGVLKAADDALDLAADAVRTALTR